jgi:hypothetical protein
MVMMTGIMTGVRQPRATMIMTIPRSANAWGALT